VQEALDTDLDAFLDRALSAQPAPAVNPALTAEKPAERLQSVLALAAEEEQWIRKSPPTVQPLENSQDLESGTCEIPEHLRPKPAPEVSSAPTTAPVQAEAPWTPPPASLPGLAVVPHPAQPGWNLPVAPAPVAPRRTPWLVTGALAGVSAASVLVAAMLWMTRDTLPEKAQAAGAAAVSTTGTVAAVAPLVKDSPLLRPLDPHLVTWIAAAESSKGTLPGPLVPGQMKPPERAVAQAAPPVVAKAEPLKPREPAHAVQARKVQPVEAPPARREIEDPTMADTEEEIPFMQEPAAARAPDPVAQAKPAPPAPPKPSEYDELDREFARQLGFTDDAVRNEPEKHGVKSVWIPPAPGGDLPQTLKPEDIQQVVAANQPAITSCIQRHKEAIPGLNGGKFMMRWFIHPNGSTYQVAMETQVLRGTAMATCIEDLVRGWKFPKHQTQMGPIRFPFIF
jgi:hypothetical protein